MRRRRDRQWLLPIAISALLAGRSALAQDSGLPPALESRGAEAASGVLPPQAPAANGPAAPVPRAAAGSGAGNAETASPGRPADAGIPPTLPINLATAMQLAGVQPLDIATAT